MEKHFLRCMHHFTSDLQDIYDEWVVGSDADAELTLPRIGQSMSVEGMGDIADSLDEIDTRL